VNTLEELASLSWERVANGAYAKASGAAGPSLKAALESSVRFPVIAEVKLASPSLGRISDHSPQRLASDYVAAGAAALSVLTSSDKFNGSLDYLAMASAQAPATLMKDIIVSPEQVEAGVSRGASAVLLIQGVFQGTTGKRLRDRLIMLAHDLKAEVVLEAGNMEELDLIMDSGADMLGVNQRDLRSLKLDETFGSQALPVIQHDKRPIILMSGIKTPEQVEAARDDGASAVLVGTSLSSSPDPAAALRALMVSR